MAGRIVLARAGSGKTYHISNDFDSQQSILLITFTNQNVQNIKDEVSARFSEKIPPNIQVITYSSFLYSWLIRPVENCFSFKKIKSSGVDIYNKPIEATYPLTPGYKKDTELEHYINTESNRYYSGRMSKLIIKEKKYIWKLIEERISLLVDTIYIDEFQDFKGEDYDLLMMLLKSKKFNTIAVGDFFQHSVAMSSMKSNRPYKKKNAFLSESEFYLKIPKSINIDDEILKASRRVPEKICDMIRKKLNIDIESCSEEKGVLEFINVVEELETLLLDNSCVKLIYSNSKKIEFQPAINWSYSKGDTYSKTLVILTDKFKDFFSEEFIVKKSISQKVINELYVALTRSNNELYICHKSLFDRYKNSIVKY